jgi:hypothetical protein
MRRGWKADPRMCIPRRFRRDSNTLTGRCRYESCGTGQTLQCGQPGAGHEARSRASCSALIFPHAKAWRQVFTRRQKNKAENRPLLFRIDSAPSAAVTKADDAAAVAFRGAAGRRGNKV